MQRSGAGEAGTPGTGPGMPGMGFGTPGLGTGVSSIPGFVPKVAIWDLHPSPCGRSSPQRTAAARRCVDHLATPYTLEAALQAAHPTPYTLHPTPYTLHPTPYTLHPTPYTLHPTPYTLHPTPYTLHPTPYTLHPAPYTLHLTPYTLHLTPYTLHPTPYTLNPRPYTPRLQARFGTSPGVWNFAMVMMASLIPRNVLSDKKAAGSLAVRLTV